VQRKHLRAVTRHDDDVAQLDETYPDKFLTCRDLRHSWQRLGFYHAGGEIVRVLICQRCDVERRDYWSPRGYRNRAAYSYPDGYKLGGGVDQQAIREAVLDRVTVHDTEESMNAALFKGRSGKRARGAS